MSLVVYKSIVLQSYQMGQNEFRFLKEIALQEYEVNGQNVAPEVYRDCREKYKEVHIFE